jgi:hypothetical protein
LKKGWVGLDSTDERTGPNRSSGVRVGGALQAVPTMNKTRTTMWGSMVAGERFVRTPPNLQAPFGWTDIVQKRAYG